MFQSMPNTNYKMNTDKNLRVRACGFDRNSKK